MDTENDKYLEEHDDKDIRRSLEYNYYLDHELQWIVGTPLVEEIKYEPEPSFLEMIVEQAGGDMDVDTMIKFVDLYERTVNLKPYTNKYKKNVRTLKRILKSGAGISSRLSKTLQDESELTS